MPGVFFGIEKTPGVHDYSQTQQYNLETLLIREIHALTHGCGKNSMLQAERAMLNLEMVRTIETKNCHDWSIKTHTAAKCRIVRRYLTSSAILEVLCLKIISYTPSDMHMVDALWPMELCNILHLQSTIYVASWQWCACMMPLVMTKMSAHQQYLCEPNGMPEIQRWTSRTSSPSGQVI